MIQDATPNRTNTKAQALRTCSSEGTEARDRAGLHTSAMQTSSSRTYSLVWLPLV